MRVIHPLYLPFRCPFHLTITLMLTLKVEQVEGTLKGVAYTLIGILWIAYVFAQFKETYFTPQEAIGDN